MSNHVLTVVVVTAFLVTLSMRLASSNEGYRITTSIAFNNKLQLSTPASSTASALRAGVTTQDDESSEGEPGAKPAGADVGSVEASQYLGNEIASDEYTMKVPKPPHIRPELVARLEEYRQQTSGPDVPAGQKVVVFRRQPGNPGLGNAMMGLVSVFLYALLSNRVLLIDWEEGYEQLDPPTAMNWKLKDYKQSGSKAEMDADEHIQSKPQYFDTCACAELSTAYPQDMLVITANQYFVPLFFFNPNYKKLLESWFGFTTEFAYYHLSHFIAKPNAQIRKVVDDYVKEHFQGFVVGIQVRIADWKPGATPADAPIFASCAQNVAATFGRRNVTYFVASDTKHIRTEFRENLGAVTFGPDEVKMYAGSDPLIDTMLLARCNAMVYSRGSTFGYVAHGYGGMRPYSVSKSGRCFQMMTSEPCMHGMDRIIGTNSNQKHVPACYSPTTWNQEIVIPHRFCF